MGKLFSLTLFLAVVVAAAAAVAVAATTTHTLLLLLVLCKFATFSAASGSLGSKWYFPKIGGGPQYRSKNLVYVCNIAPQKGTPQISGNPCPHTPLYDPSFNFTFMFHLIRHCWG